MLEIIWDKANEWTARLGPLDARIKVFEEIRDIPYYLVPSIEDPYEWAASILAENKGSCSPKHYLLGLLFEKMGLPVKYVTYPYHWNKQPLPYPPELKGLAEGTPIAYHVACKANIEGRWVLIDVTWDSHLQKAGFPVNEAWDGLHDTQNAYMPLEEIPHKNLEQRLEFVKKKRNLYTDKEKVVYAQFTLEFNSWLQRVRQR
ncbi:MAG: hypothetical protein C4540_06820 [Candidatus Omnitrophota bacterium]|nr:MAG: hypothetical protein C4540_06820 [Candidatus Omnitrophota bacterium]